MRINWKQPFFWKSPNLPLFHPARLLTPVSWIVGYTTACRVRSQQILGEEIPVICCGGATVGGDGKTTLAIAVAKKLKAYGYKPGFISHGYKGELQEAIHLINKNDTADMVGDEAKVLAEHFPCWVGRNRYDLAKAAISQGVNCLVLDDGLQNSTLKPTLNILSVNGHQAFGNKKLIPLGPLRENLVSLKNRVSKIVFFDEDKFGLLPSLETDFEVHKAKLILSEEYSYLNKLPIVAFTGLNNPSKFFNMLLDAGLDIIATLPYPNHYAYKKSDILKLITLYPDATLVCTPKDYVKICDTLKDRVLVIEPEIRWSQDDALDSILEGLKRVQ